MRRYSAYREEAFNDFPEALCGKTYFEIEDYCKRSWPRYQPLVWRAYRSADELARSDDGKGLELKLKGVGVYHFARLNRIFDYMVLTHKPDDITTDGIVSSTGVLYGGVSDYDYLDKAVRDWVRHLILNMFVVGIAWLTQMYIYMLDTFRQNVKLYLLAPGKYNHLVHHIIFLNAVDRDFHKTTRTWIRKAVQTIRDTCDSYSAYAHYDITARLKKQTFAIPTHIKHKLFDQKVLDLLDGTDQYDADEHNSSVTIAEIFERIPKQKLLDRIFGSESFLTQDRDPQTLNHHENGRSAIHELYQAICGQIINVTFSQFYSNVVIRIQEFGSPKLFGAPTGAHSLHTRLNRMALTQISNIANINTEAIRQEIEACEKQIGDLTIAHKLLDNAIRVMSSSSPASIRSDQQRQQEYANAVEAGKATVENLQRRRGLFNQQHRPERGRLERFSSATSVDHTNSSERYYKDESDEEEQELMNETADTRAKILMFHMYQRHDRQDLQLGLPSKDSLSQDELKPRSLAHIYVDPDTLDYDKAIQTILDMDGIS
ncbi:unnamed protein product [Rotaria sp. Silwood2]|nr:unnamed protein product [Rotaria sp. Silwood2]